MPSPCFSNEETFPSVCQPCANATGAIQQQAIKTNFPTERIPPPGQGNFNLELTAGPAETKCRSYIYCFAADVAARSMTRSNFSNSGLRTVTYFVATSFWYTRSPTFRRDAERNPISCLYPAELSSRYQITRSLFWVSSRR